MSTDADRSDLLDLAGSVADRTPIDWTRAGEDGSRAVARLQDMERVIRAFRTAATPPDDAGREASPRGDGPRPSFRWGPLEVYERVGSGSFGDVYRAVDARLDVEVALKLGRSGAPDAPGNSALLEEARRMARVRHPNVVTVHGADVAGGRVGFWMDFVRGSTLAATLDARGRIPEVEAAAIGADLCAALSSVHAEGLVHGDVKPGNIMLGTNGRTLLTDFGASSSLRSRDAGIVRATPRVTAPEVWRGEDVSPAADLYALGVVLFRAVSGVWPVEGVDADEIAANLARLERLDLAARCPNLTERFVAAVEHALSRDPASRPASAEALRSALVGAVPKADIDDVPAAAAGEAGTNLPVPLSTFVGREREVREIASRLRAHRVVTLTGAGGSGKTRLAQQIGRELIGEHAGGVWWVELADALDRPGVLGRVARVLGVADAASDLLPRVCERLARRRALLILDNCEHVRSVSREIVAAISSACGTTSVLSTSREPLHVGGEAVVRVAPLRLPSAEDDPHVACATAEATQLFVDRAAAARADFELTPSVAKAVVEICRRVEGLPLALELAASRVSGLAVEDIARALERHVDLLGRSRRAGAARHRTLEACIDWSHDLLDDAERRVFRRLAVFRGGWRLSDAEVVCCDAELEAASVAAIVCTLAEKSLVDVASFPVEEPRYRMLELVREYATHRLEESGERAARDRRHTERFLEVARREAGSIDAPDAVPALRRVEADLDNFRAALARSIDAERDLCAELGTALGKFWIRGEHWSEGRAWCAQLLSGAQHPDPATRAALQCTAGQLEYASGDRRKALAHYDAAIAIFARIDDRAGEANALQGHAACLHEIGDLDGAERALRKSLAAFRDSHDHHRAACVEVKLATALGVKSAYREGDALAASAERYFREAGDWFQVANALRVRGDLAADSGDPAAATRLRRDCLGIARLIEATYLEAIALTGLADLALDAGDLAAARSLAEPARRIFHELGAVDEGVVLRILAMVALAEGDLPTARRRLKRVLHLRLEQKAERRVAIIVWMYSRLALALDRPRLAARLQGAAHARAMAMGVPAGMGALRGAREDERAVRDALGAEAYERERAAGEALTLDEAIGRALAACG